MHYSRFIPLFFVLFSVFGFQSFSQESLPLTDFSELQHDLLNRYLLDEVNVLRRKARTHELDNNTLLLAPAQDHADYMKNRQKIGHFQKTKPKKSPKNRVDFYKAPFEIVGENVLVTNLNLSSSRKDKRNPRLDTYEKLADQLVKLWENSPPHYANMISDDYLFTYTQVSLGEDGAVYACQLFSGNEYHDKYSGQTPELNYDLPNKKQCKQYIDKEFEVYVFVDQNNEIFVGATEKSDFNMFLKNGANTGLAADIVLKSQYPNCGEPYFNPIPGIRGIGLPPVFKKDFNKHGRWKRKQPLISLGFVPDYIDEAYEVNLTMVYKNCPCATITYNHIPLQFYGDLKLDMSVDTAQLVEYKTWTEPETLQLEYHKSGVAPIKPIEASVLTAAKSAKNIQIIGYASIEGEVSDNIKLFNARANHVRDELVKAGVAESSISIRAQENFKDFRKDILGTQWAYLQELTDEALKKKMLNKPLADSLEHLLKNHRYVSLQLETEHHDTITAIPTQEISNFQESIELEAYDQAMEHLAKLNNLVINGKMSLTDYNEVNIVLDKKTALLELERYKLNFQFAAMYAAMDSTGFEQYNSSYGRAFKEQTNALHLAFPKNKTIANAEATIHFYTSGVNYTTEKGYEDYLEHMADSNQYVDKKVNARLHLNLAAIYDLTKDPLSLEPDEFKGVEAVEHVKKARLSIDETFDLASYYMYIRNPEIAYDLVKKVIDDTEETDNILLFIKLIHYLDIDINERKIEKYLDIIRQQVGDEEFCTYFHSPQLNFQILDNDTIREMHCEACSQNSNTAAKASE